MSRYTAPLTPITLRRSGPSREMGGFRHEIPQAGDRAWFSGRHNSHPRSQGGPMQRYALKWLLPGRLALEYRDRPPRLPGPPPKDRRSGLVSRPAALRAKVVKPDFFQWNGCPNPGRRVGYAGKPFSGSQQRGIAVKRTGKPFSSSCVPAPSPHRKPLCAASQTTVPLSHVAR